MKNNKFNIILIPIILAIVSLIALGFSSLYPKTKNTKTYTNFLDDLNNKDISKVYFDSSSKILVTLNDGYTYSTDNPNSENFKENLLLNNINVVEEPIAPLNKSIPAVILIISIFFIVFLKVNKGFPSKTSFGELNLQDFSNKDLNKYNFTKVAGNAEAKESLNDIVDFLKSPEKYSAYGAKMPKGIILYGPPGTGKTLLAKAVAGEACVPFYALSGSDFIQVYAGVGASRIRNLFKKAKSHGKAVIFIDEIDAIGKRRSSGNTSSTGNDERDQTLNALLTEMSGFNDSDGIIVIAATNRLDTLDPALLRPGRFDRHVEVSLPDLKAREQILKLYLKNKPHKTINIETLAKKTAYFSGAKLESLINEAAILAAKRNKGSITSEEINDSFSLVLAGANKKERSHLKKEDLTLTAYHEAGHALVSLIVLPEETISKISIIPTTKGAGGYTITIPQDSNYQRINYLKSKIMVLLGGRASEEVTFNKSQISTGAQGDLGQVTDIALAMISEYGMGESLGLLKISNLGNLTSSYGHIIVEEAKLLINELYEETKNLLSNNKVYLDKLALLLLENETLHDEEIENFRNKVLKEFH
ncbi:MAG: AAA family ATPase [Clostridium sp.]|nr:AAA family ATPase [Clostridium sp.]